MNIKCESCHQLIDRLMFKIIFDNGAWFNVCERCTPVDSNYQIEVFDLIALREREDEQST